MNAEMPQEVAALYHAENFDVTTSEHTDLESVPTAAHIKFAGESETREGLDVKLPTGERSDYWPDKVLEIIMSDSIEIPFFIERAMLDPDAEVIPYAE